LKSVANGLQVRNYNDTAFSQLDVSILTLQTDVILARDAANTLAQRNGTAAQAFRLYNTFTATDNFERANIFWDSNVLKIGTEKGSVGGTARNLELQTDGTTRLSIDTSGNVVIPIADNSGTVRIGGAGVGTTLGVDEDGSLLIRRINSSAFGLAMGSRGGSDGHALAVGSSTFIGFASINQPDGDSTLDVRFGRAAAGIASLYGTGGTGAALELYEQTAPSAPAADGVRIYAVDNGSGKTQLMALFATGAAQQIAIEP
jgi:hypothetical protein